MLEHQGGAAVAAALTEQIARFNQAGKMSAKRGDGAARRGMDQYSRWHLEALPTAVGAAGIALIDTAFPWQEAEAENRTRDGAAVDGAGLAAQLAIRKVQVERVGAGAPKTGSRHVR